MKQQIYSYELYLFDDKEPRELTQEQGEKLAMVLTSPDSPRFVLINDNILNVNSVKEVRRKKEYTSQKGYSPEKGDYENKESFKREYTLEEKATHDKYLDLKSKFNFNMLSPQSRSEAQESSAGEERKI